MPSWTSRTPVVVDLADQHPAVREELDVRPAGTAPPRRPARRRRWQWAAPVPAKVSIWPLGSTSARACCRSRRCRCCRRCRASTPYGLFSRAVVAGDLVAVVAGRAVARDRGDDAVRRHLADAVVALVGDVQRAVRRRERRRTASSAVAAVAWPPSPENPAVPVPATVVMMPVPAATLRIRLLPESAMYRLPAASKDDRGRARRAARWSRRCCRRCSRRYRCRRPS